MKEFYYEIFNGKILLKGNLISSKESEKKETRETKHLGNGVYTEFKTDIETRKEKWEILKTDKTKEIIDIERHIQHKKNGELFSEWIYWKSLSDKLANAKDTEEVIKIAKKYGDFEREF